MKSYMLALKNTFNFSERTSQNEFWIPYIVNFILINFISYLLQLSDVFYKNDKKFYSLIFIVLLLSFIFMLILSSLSLLIRRLRDAGYSPLFILVPVYNIIICFFPSDPRSQRSGLYPKSSVPLKATPNTSQHNNPYDVLERLASLRQQGILSEEEFLSQKQKILNSLS